jgi:hypothetical protein
LLILDTEVGGLGVGSETKKIITSSACSENGP